jgi:Uma2 family endonuclease
MSPTKPKHGRIEIRFGRILDTFVTEHGLGEIQGGEVGIYTRRDPDTVRGADILFISHERLARATPGDFLDVAPELVVEILSPSDRWSEVKKKLREYLEAGVAVVLVVDPEEHSVSVYRSLTDIHELTADDVLTVEDVLPGFSVPVAHLFAGHKVAR